MFLLGKLLLILLKPLTWIVIVFLVGLLSKKPARKRTILIGAFVMLLFFSNPFFFRILARSYEMKPVVLNKNEKYQAGIVLGGFTSYNDKTGKAYFSESADRFIQVALLYKTGHIGKVIVSGGNGYAVKNDFREADFARQHLEELGIPSTDIFTEDSSRNTYQNALFTRRLCDSLKYSGPFLLVSSALHLRRATSLFRKQKLEVQPYPCDFLTQNLANNFWEDYLIPSSSTLYQWDLLIKEIVGLVVYKMVGKA